MSTGGIGRVLAAHGTGLHHFDKSIRGLLMENGLDFDISNAGPSLVLNICEAMNLNCGYIKGYVQDRSDWWDLFSDAVGLNEGQGKQLMVQVTYLNTPLAALQVTSYIYFILHCLHLLVPS